VYKNRLEPAGGTDAPRVAGTAKRLVISSQASGSRSEISSNAAATCLVCQLADNRTIAWQVKGKGVFAAHRYITEGNEPVGPYR
jgi:hypothetical protein